jgi:(S)-ureidoglycine aminohydrolase
MKISAETRTSVSRDHALIAPDGWVSSVRPGWVDSQVHVIINERMGAHFTQLLIFMNEKASGVENTGTNQYFFYVMEGQGKIFVDEVPYELTSGTYVYIPPACQFRVSSGGALKLTAFIKKYLELEGYRSPSVIFGNSSEVPAGTYLDDTQLHMQNLLPDDLSFDMAVNIFTYQPGGHLPFVETHVMEHGLIYLQGQGIYRLSDSWYPVKTDDCIWMAPYCPQWFVAMGKQPAVYLYYKDVNRW